MQCCFNWDNFVTANDQSDIKFLPSRVGSDEFLNQLVCN